MTDLQETTSSSWPGLLEGPTLLELPTQHSDRDMPIEQPPEGLGLKGPTTSDPLDSDLRSDAPPFRRRPLPDSEITGELSTERPISQGPTLPSNGGRDSGMDWDSTESQEEMEEPRLLLLSDHRLTTETPSVEHSNGWTTKIGRAHV